MLGNCRSNHFIAPPQPRRLEEVTEHRRGAAGAPNNLLGHQIMTVLETRLPLVQSIIDL
jgi:hypothetical protein